jgi:hypothetical protein
VLVGFGYYPDNLVKIIVHTTVEKGLCLSNGLLNKSLLMLYGFYLGSKGLLEGERGKRNR